MDTTTIDIDALEAGRELDALVAERVMGWKLGKDRITRPDGSSFNAPINDMWYDPLYGRYSLPPYSTDIEAAWQIVEYMKSQHDMVFALMNRHEGRGAIKDWRADFYPFISDRNRSGYAYGETAPEAICRAALKATTE